MFQFGIGGLYINPLNVTGSVEAANPTPEAMLTIQDVSVDISQELKDLTGQYKFPDDVAPGAAKISGKFTVGRINMAAFNQIFFAQTQTTGTKQITPQPGEAHTVPASSTYTITVTQSAAFSTDLGVIYQATGQSFVKVTSVTAKGQYSEAAGVYTFYSGDASAAVYIAYVWTDATDGYTVPMVQQLMGVGPVFELWLSEPYQAITGSGGTGTPQVYNGLHVFSARLSKLGQSFKNNDYNKPEWEWQGYANSAGQVAEFFQVAP